MLLFFTTFTNDGQEYVAFGKHKLRLPVYKPIKGYLHRTEMNHPACLQSLPSATNQHLVEFRSLDAITKQFGEVVRPDSPYDFTVLGILDADCSTSGVYWITTESGDCIYAGESDNMSDDLYNHSCGYSEEAKCIYDDQENHYPAKFGFERIIRPIHRKNLIEQWRYLWPPLCT